MSGTKIGKTEDAVDSLEDSHRKWMMRRPSFPIIVKRRPSMYEISLDDPRVND